MKAKRFGEEHGTGRSTRSPQRNKSRSRRGEHNCCRFLLRPTLIGRRNGPNCCFLFSRSRFPKAALQRVNLNGVARTVRHHWITSSARTNSDCGIERPISRRASARRGLRALRPIRHISDKELWQLNVLLEGWGAEFNPASRASRSPTKPVAERAGFEPAEGY